MFFFSPCWITGGVLSKNPLYINVGVAENCSLARNNVVSFSVVLRAGVKYTKIGFIN